MTAGPRHPRLGADVRIAAALGQQQNPQTGGRPEGRCQQRGVRGGKVGDSCDAEPDKLFGGFGPDTPERIDLAVAHHRHPVGLGEREDACRFAEAGGHLCALLVVADADRTRQSGACSDDLADLLGQLDRVLRVVEFGADIGLVPAPDLDRVADIAQQSHHLLRRVVIGIGVQGQEYRVRAFASRRAQRHACVDAVLAGRIRRARHDLSRLGGIAVAADDDRQPGEFGIAPYFDRSLELVKVDVQDPVSHVPQSLRAKLSHLSPRDSSVSPRSVSWWCT